MISMLRALLAKDFARTRRNPLPWLLFLLAPLCVAGIIGFFVQKDVDQLNEGSELIDLNG